MTGARGEAHFRLADRLHALAEDLYIVVLRHILVELLIGAGELLLVVLAEPYLVEDRPQMADRDRTGPSQILEECRPVDSRPQNHLILRISRVARNICRQKITQKIPEFPGCHAAPSTFHTRYSRRLFLLLFTSAVLIP